MKKESKERIFHIDSPQVMMDTGKIDIRRGANSTADGICCITMSDVYLMIGRESGLVQR